MDLTIIITTLNNKKMLKECIDSVKKYTTTVSYEIIVVDNHSSDGTQNMIRVEYPDIQLIANEKNLGFHKANNKALRIAKGRYSVLLNDDTYITHDALGKIVKFMDANQNVGVCGPKLLNIDGSIQQHGSILAFYKLRSKTPIDIGLIIGACMFIRMSIIPKVGLLDENLFFYHDDLDYCLRVKAAGYKVMYFPESEVYHYGGVSSKKTKRSSLYFIEGIRGGLYFCKKHYQYPVYLIYRVFLLATALFMIPVSMLTYPLNKERIRTYTEILRIILKEELMSNISLV